MNQVTYLLYILIYVFSVLGSSYYAVFYLNKSEWWFLLSVLLLGAAHTPRQWAALSNEIVQTQIHFEKMAKIRKKQDV